MANVIADEKYERILRSLKENSVEFVRRDRAQRTARIRLVIRNCLIFAAGAALGVLVTLAI